MKKIFQFALFILSAMFFAGVAFAQSDLRQDNLNFDKTLRLNYIFTGGVKPVDIALANAASYEGWWGRRFNLTKVPVMGNGTITLRDSLSNDVLYTHSFCTLFSEWLSTEEAGKITKAFENVLLVPMPAKSAKITVEIYGVDNSTIATYSHFIDPGDILIKPYAVNSKDASGELNGVEFRYIHRGGDSRECIDVVVVSEGYSAEEKEKFYADAKESTDEILRYEPFHQYRARFNFIAVFAPSADSGVSIPGKNEWKNTVLGSHFSTFYMDRYLTTLNIFKLHDVISAVPYEHIIILANTENYGGGGIYNSYVLSAAGNRWHKPVVVHEFGHSFGALADEYFYDDEVMDLYNSKVEPWEPNLTTLVDFGSKWKDMLGSDYKIVTKAMQGSDYLSTLKPKDYKLGLYEGGGYRSEGVYRPFPTCRMRDNKYPTFCPVCERAISNIILYNTEQQ